MKFNNNNNNNNNNNQVYEVGRTQQDELKNIIGLITESSPILDMEKKSPYVVTWHSVTWR